MINTAKGLIEVGDAMIFLSYSHEGVMKGSGLTLLPALKEAKQQQLKLDQRLK
jgi:hypothetical protein